LKPFVSHNKTMRLSSISQTSHGVFIFHSAVFRFRRNAGFRGQFKHHSYFVIGTNDFLLDGNRFQIRCGEIHAARVPMEYWRQRLKMARAMA